MPLSCPTDEISLNHLQEDISGYNFSLFRQDLMAGLSVALLSLPQAMAYAMLAGLPLSCGLFAAIYASIIAALFGSSRQMIVGPSNAIALLIQSGTQEVLYTFYRDLTYVQQEILAIQILTQIAIVVAILQIFAAWCRLGKLIQFVSYSVVVGYILGSAVAVIISQLFVFFGIPRMQGVHSLYEQVIYLFSHMTDLNWATTFIGFLSLSLLLSLKKMGKKIPAALITLFAIGLLVELLGLSSYSGSSLLSNFYEDEAILPNISVMGDNAEFYELVPDIDFPFFNLRIMNGILPVAFAIALLGIMETTSVAKTLAANSGHHFSVNQEIFGIGLGNLVSAFSSAMPVSGSPSRTGLNYISGGQTRFSAVFAAIFIAFIVFILDFLVTRIPLATLASLLLVTAVGIVNRKQLTVCLKATNSDAFVLWATFFSCIFFSLDVAFYIGVILSITFYLQKAAEPQLAEYEIDESGELKNIDSHQQGEKVIRVIKVDGELFFGAADIFHTTLKAITKGDTSTKVIILQLKNARDIDATACLALQQLHDYLKGSNRHLVACGLTPPIWEVLSCSGLVEQIGKENLFLFDDKHPHLHMQNAYLWAKSLVNV